MENQDNRGAAAGLPSCCSEAPGVAWCKVFTPDGVEVSLTVRADSLRAALDELLDGIRYAVEQHGFRLRYAPEALSGESGGVGCAAGEERTAGHRVRLEYAKHIISRKNGRHYLVLHGGDGNDYYSSAEVAGIGDWQGWPVGVRVGAGKGGYIEFDEGGRVVGASFR